MHFTPLFEATTQSSYNFFDDIRFSPLIASVKQSTLFDFPGHIKKAQSIYALIMVADKPVSIPAASLVICNLSIVHGVFFATSYELGAS